MQGNVRPQLHRRALLAATLLVFSPFAARSQTATTASTAEAATDLKTLASTVQQLESQIQMLNSQVSELRAAQEDARRESEGLRAELARMQEQLAAMTRGGHEVEATMASQPAAASPASGTAKVGQEAGSSLEERVSKLEEAQELTNDKVVEQSQTKVESGSKYRVRLSGIVLLNTDVTRGSVDNLDFPQIATAPVAPGSSGAFSGSLRQSQIGLEAFGPDIAGARTSANIKFDFAGGFADLPNGDSFGIMRLRTGTIRLDWENTSIVAGQDALFFAPLTPTTLSSLAIPALSYSGNLWSWTPQIRIEHSITLTDASRLTLQGGILDPLTGNVPEYAYRYPTAGEQSGQPAYAARIAWSHRAFGKELTIGEGGYYGRQNWGYGRDLDGWAVTSDVTVPLGGDFAFSGEFYRGRSLGGLGGGIGQSILLAGAYSEAGTAIHGLDSMGGWVQLKYQPMASFEVNFAYGQDNPFANELRAFPGSSYYYGPLLSRNLSPFVNFIYRVRSDVLFSVEYRRLQTYTLDANANVANQIGLSLGYLF